MITGILSREILVGGGGGVSYEAWTTNIIEELRDTLNERNTNDA